MTAEDGQRSPIPTMTSIMTGRRKIAASGVGGRGGSESHSQTQHSLPHSSSQLNLPVIIGAIVGIGLLLLVLFFLYRRLKEDELHRVRVAVGAGVQRLTLTLLCFSLLLRHRIHPTLLNSF
ncbi:hypothetical protein SLE2022_330090 [Rubroshorea leprosula]